MDNIKIYYYRYLFLIWPVVTGLSSVIIIVFVLLPQFSSYFETNHQITSLADKTLVLEAKATELQSLDKDQINKDLQVTFSVLPSELDLPMTYVVIQDTVKKSGLTVKTLNMGAADSKNNSVAVNIVVSGNLSTVEKFISSLQDNPRVFSVQSISVSYLKDGVDVEMPLLIYYQPLGQIVLKPEDPAKKLSESDNTLLQKLNQIVSAAPQFDFSETPDTSSIPLGKLNPFE